jgi:hypothetical protein
MRRIPTTHHKGVEDFITAANIPPCGRRKIPGLHPRFVCGTVQPDKNLTTAMKELIDAWKKVDRNKVAVVLSVVPGLGHLYKHHYLAGFGILTIGNIVMLFIAGLMSLGTLGVSLIAVPAVWFAAIAYSAYAASDEHGMHPWLHVWEYHWADFLHRSKKV